VRGEVNLELRTENPKAEKNNHRIKPESKKAWITIQDVSKSKKTQDANKGANNSKKQVSNGTKTMQNCL